MLIQLPLLILKKEFVMNYKHLITGIATATIACGFLSFVLFKNNGSSSNRNNILQEESWNDSSSIIEGTPYAGKPLEIHKGTLSNGFSVYGFDFGAMKSLHGEIFDGDVYRFTASNDSPIIIDCGSNIGFSVLYFKSIYPKSIIYAFEPDRASYKLLKHNVLANSLTDVHAFNVALNEKPGKMTFYFDKDKPGDPCMSLYMKGSTSVDVKVEQLSTYIQEIDKLHKKKIDLLKLDVEGAEHGVLKNLAETKTINSVQEMIIEYHHHMGNTDDKLGSFLKTLEDHGFGYQVATYDQRSFPSRGGGQSFMLHAYRKNT